MTEGNVPVSDGNTVRIFDTTLRDGEQAPGAGLTAGGLKEAYTAGVRRVAARWMGHLARTPISPDALTFAGVTICVIASVVVYFEYRNELLFFWLGAAVFVIGASSSRKSSGWCLSAWNEPSTVSL